jgi:hypothetical protein
MLIHNKERLAHAEIKRTVVRITGLKFFVFFNSL